MKAREAAQVKMALKTLRAPPCRGPGADGAQSETAKAKGVQASGAEVKLCQYRKKRDFC